MKKLYSGTLKLAYALGLLLTAKQVDAQCTLTPMFYTSQLNSTVNFVNGTSGTTGATTYTWSFGDGSPDAYTLNASHSYTASGPFTVALFASNNSTPACVSATTLYINPCSGSFLSYVDPVTGVGTFSSNITPTGGYFNWYFGPNATPSSQNGTSAIATTTYNVANTSQTVSMSYANFTGGLTCTLTTAQVVTVGAVSNPCALNASFGQYQAANGVTNFNNTSTNTSPGVTYSWNFGDGNTSTSTSPTHTYAANGSYVVTLTANNNYTSSCTSTYTTMVQVNTYCALNASFNLTNGSNGAVSFTSTSTGLVSPNFQWTFGDGTTQNTFGNGSTYHIYPTAGNYTITLVVTNTNIPGCSSSYQQTVAITSTCNLNPSFSAPQAPNGMTYFNNLTVGTSTGVTYSWNFGDGGTSTLTSPSHSYAANGPYLVTLTADNNLTPNCTATYTAYVNITSYCTGSTSIVYSQGSNGLVSFTNNTIGGTAGVTIWTFGDGSSPSYVVNPNHTYTANGNYVVMLTVFNSSVAPTCTSVAQTTINVTSVPAPTCVANANFTMAPSGTPGYWYAVPASTANIANANWYWGDGSMSSGLLGASHTYSVAGNYTICLTVTLTCGSSASYCGLYYVSKSAGTTGMVHIDVVGSIPVTATGINSTAADKVVYTIAPNPNNGQFNVNISGLNGSTAKIQVYNLIGKLVYETSAETSKGSVNKDIKLDNVSAGTYFIKVSDGTTVQTRKLIVND